MSISIAENKDCMVAMAEFPDKFFDLAVVDPPYGINAPNMQMGHRTNKPSIAATLRKSRLASGSTSNWDTAIPTEAYFKELMRVAKDQVIWGGNYFPLPPTRCVLCWYKVQPWEVFSQWEMAWTSFDRPAALFRMPSATVDRKSKIHPTQKPVQLYQWVLRNYAKPGFKILDTHLGSGSSRLAAYMEGCDFYGYEIDELYFKDQEKRFHGESNLFNL